MFNENSFCVEKYVYICIKRYCARIIYNHFVIPSLLLRELRTSLSFLGFHWKDYVVWLFSTMICSMLSIFNSSSSLLACLKSKFNLILRRHKTPIDSRFHCQKKTTLLSKCKSSTTEFKACKQLFYYFPRNIFDFSLPYLSRCGINVLYVPSIDHDECGRMMNYILQNFIFKMIGWRKYKTLIRRQY